MKTLVVEPGYAPYEKELKGLREMQDVVGGHIQVITPFAGQIKDAQRLAGKHRGRTAPNKSARDKGKER